jgi:hypothetical protein
MDFLTRIPSRRRAPDRGLAATVLVERLERRALLTLQVGPIAAIAGQTFNGPVATFAGGDLQGTLVDFQATISWGGGLSSSSPGTIAPNGQGGYTVSGSNLYPEPGHYTLGVVVTGANGTAIQNTGPATVSDAALTSTGVTIHPLVQAPFSGVVASFTSANPYANTSDFSATIDWGDGINTDTPGIIAANGGGGFNVVGQMGGYQKVGTFPITVTIKSPGGQLTVANSTASVTALPISIYPINVTGAVDQPLTGVPVATFVDPYLADTAGDFQATIDWGDGTTSPGTIGGGVNGVYTVTGSKPGPYLAAGTFTVNTQVVRTASQQTASASGQAVITESTPVLVPTGVLLVEPAGATLNNVQVGAFTDSNSGAQDATFSVAINWGNGQTTPGTATFISMSAGISLFSVTGTNVYTTPGTYPVTVTVNDNQGDSTTISSTAIATGPVLTPIGALITATAGVPLPNSTIVGSFLDSHPADGPGDFQASIAWGDGHTSVGSVASVPGSPGLFTVSGTNLYTTPGTETISIRVQNNQGQSTTILSTAVVITPFLSATGTSFSATPGVPLPPNTIVANFTDSDHNATAGNLIAAINWGDGQTSNGEVNLIGSTGTTDTFTVTGTHIYATPSTTGSYAVTVTIVDPSGQSVQANSTAIVTAFINATGAAFGAISGEPFTGTVALFTDTNPGALTNRPTAVINWGDGRTGAGLVSLVSTTGSIATFTVLGTHTYSTAGTAASYPVTVTILDPSGQTATANSTAIVGNPGAATVTGGLADVITNGPHAAAGFTNTNRPTFTGTTAPFAIVQLYARHFHVDAEMPLGEAVADGNGHWSLTTGPLAVGIYIVTATVTIPGGYPSGMITLYNQNGTDLVYIDLSPRLVRWLSHGKKSIPHARVHVAYPRAARPQWVGHHRA